jgi:hypothetical protein
VLVALGFVEVSSRTEVPRRGQGEEDLEPLLPEGSFQNQKAQELQSSKAACYDRYVFRCVLVTVWHDPSWVAVTFVAAHIDGLWPPDTTDTNMSGDPFASHILFCVFPFSR